MHGLLRVLGPFMLLTATAQNAIFDVVSVKKNISRDLSSRVSESPNGGLTATNVPVATLIARAYPPATPREMKGLPDWAMNDRYDVSATASLSAPTREDRNAMLRAMLADRFQLRVHSEMSRQLVLALETLRRDSRLGPGLTPSSSDCSAVYNSPRPPIAPGGPPVPCTLLLSVDSGRLEGETSMADLARLLKQITAKVVIDKTGLTGFYRVVLQFDVSATMAPAKTPSSGDLPDIFTAVREQLGLRLVSTKADVDTLVIDRLERPTND